MSDQGFSRPRIFVSLGLVVGLVVMTFLWSNHSQSLAPRVNQVDQELGQPSAGQILGQATPGGSGQVKLVSARAFQASLEESADGILLDIRRPEEISQAKIEGALEINFEASDFEAQLDQLDRQQTYYLYCNSGNRSAQAATMMKAKGFTQVTELQGGIQAWVGGGFPTCQNC